LQGKLVSLMRNIRVGMYVFTSDHEEYRHLASYLEEFISLKEIELVLLGGTELTENKARVTSVAEELFPGMKVSNTAVHFEPSRREGNVARMVALILGSLRFKPKVISARR
jgi:hypothetical protein